MHIKYKIIKVTPEDHSICVRFFTDLCPEESLVTERNPDGSILRCQTDYNITLWNTGVLTNDELVREISRHAPTQWFQLREQLENPLIDTSMSNLTPMINQEFSVVAAESTVQPLVEIVINPIVV